LPRLRAAAQLLHRPVSIREPVEIARAIAGPQAQDLYAGPLTFRSRNRRLTAADIDRARTEERSLLRTWVMRMTIHMIPTDDAGWMLTLFEPAIEKWSRRRLEHFGMSPGTQSKALGVVKRALEKEGPLTRPEIAERISRAGIELDSSTRLHIILVAVTSGIVCLGPDRGRSTSCLVLRDDWLGQLPHFDRDAALAELARRYLRAFGPATERDFAYWSGLGLREVRAGLAGIASELTESGLGDDTMLSLKGKRSRLPPTGQVRMLGAFDTYMLGYRSRDLAVPPEHVAAVKEGGGGWIRPVIVRDGVVVGGWRSTRSGGRIETSLNLLQPLSAAVRKAIDAEVADIARFEGLPVRLTQTNAAASPPD
jgi:hypothetical protein